VLTEERKLQSLKVIIRNMFMSKYLLLFAFTFAVTSNLFAASVNVPFEFHNNHIYLKTQINGKGVYYFLFDSGAGASGSMIDASVAESLKLPVKGYINANMIGGNRGIAYTEDVKFLMGSLMFDEKKVAFMALKEQEREEQHQIDGIFGYSLIKNYVVEVDYQKSILTFYRPGEYKKPKYARTVELLDINQNKVPIVQGKIISAKGKPLETGIIVDTGYDGNFLLGRKFVEENKLQTDVISALTTSGKGLGGKTSLKKGKIQSLLLGNTGIRNPETVFAFDEEGNFAGNRGFLGGNFLKRHKLVLNYKDGYLLLL
jgi:hypothetical protein